MASRNSGLSLDHATPNSSPLGPIRSPLKLKFLERRGEFVLVLLNGRKCELPNDAFVVTDKGPKLLMSKQRLRRILDEIGESDSTRSTNSLTSIGSFSTAALTSANTPRSECENSEAVIGDDDRINGRKRQRQDVDNEEDSSPTERYEKTQFETDPCEITPREKNYKIDVDVRDVNDVNVSSSDDRNDEPSNCPRTETVVNASSQKESEIEAAETSVNPSSPVVDSKPEVNSESPSYSPKSDFPPIDSPPPKDGSLSQDGELSPQTNEPEIPNEDNDLVEGEEENSMSGVETNWEEISDKGEVTPSPTKDTLSSIPNRKRKSMEDDEAVKIAILDHGWKREVFRRIYQSTGRVRTDVFYRSPQGKRLNSKSKIMAYLDESKENRLTEANFSFSRRLFLEGDHPSETLRTSIVEEDSGTPCNQDLTNMEHNMTDSNETELVEVEKIRDPKDEPERKVSEEVLLSSDEEASDNDFNIDESVGDDPIGGRNVHMTLDSEIDWDAIAARALNDGNRLKKTKKEALGISSFFVCPQDQTTLLAPKTIPSSKLPCLSCSIILDPECVAQVSEDTSEIIVDASAGGVYFVPCSQCRRGKAPQTKRKRQFTRSLASTTMGASTTQPISVEPAFAPVGASFSTPSLLVDQEVQRLDLCNVNSTACSRTFEEEQNSLCTTFPTRSASATFTMDEEESFWLGRTAKTDSITSVRTPMHSTRPSSVTKDLGLTSKLVQLIKRYRCRDCRVVVEKLSNGSPLFNDALEVINSARNIQLDNQHKDRDVISTKDNLDSIAVVEPPIKLPTYPPIEALAKSSVKAEETPIDEPTETLSEPLKETSVVPPVVLSFEESPPEATPKSSDSFARAPDDRVKRPKFRTNKDKHDLDYTAHLSKKFQLKKFNIFLVRLDLTKTNHCKRPLLTDNLSPSSLSSSRKTVLAMRDEQTPSPRHEEVCEACPQTPKVTATSGGNYREIFKTGNETPSLGAISHTDRTNDEFSSDEGVISPIVISEDFSSIDSVVTYHSGSSNVQGDNQPYDVQPCNDPPCYDQNQDDLSYVDLPCENSPCDNPFRDNQPNDYMLCDDGPRDDTPREDAPHDDAPHDDKPRDETPRDDAPHVNGPRDNATRDNAPYDDERRNDSPHDASRDDQPRDDPTCDDSPREGPLRIIAPCHDHPDNNSTKNEIQSKILTSNVSDDVLIDLPTESVNDAPRNNTLDTTGAFLHDIPVEIPTVLSSVILDDILNGSFNDASPSTKIVLGTREILSTDIPVEPLPQSQGKMPSNDVIFISNSEINPNVNEQIKANKLVAGHAHLSFDKNDVGVITNDSRYRDIPVADPIVSLSSSDDNTTIPAVFDHDPLTTLCSEDNGDDVDRPIRCSSHIDKNLVHLKLKGLQVSLTRCDEDDVPTSRTPKALVETSSDESDNNGSEETTESAVCSDFGTPISSPTAVTAFRKKSSDVFAEKKLLCEERNPSLPDSSSPTSDTKRRVPRTDVVKSLKGSKRDNVDSEDVYKPSEESVPKNSMSALKSGQKSNSESQTPSNFSSTSKLPPNSAEKSSLMNTTPKILAPDPPKRQSVKVLGKEGGKVVILLQGKKVFLDENDVIKTPEGKLKFIVTKRRLMELLRESGV